MTSFAQHIAANSVLAGIGSVTKGLRIRVHADQRLGAPALVGRFTVLSNSKGHDALLDTHLADDVSHNAFTQVRAAIPRTGGNASFEALHDSLVSAVGGNVRHLEIINRNLLHRSQWALVGANPDDCDWERQSTDRSGAPYNPETATSFFVYTDPFAPGVEMGDVDDTAAMVAAIGAMKKGVNARFTFIIGRAAENDGTKRFNSFMHFTDPLYMHIKKFARRHPDQLRFTDSDHYDATTLATTDIVLVHSSVQKKVLDVLKFHPVVHFQGQSYESDFNPMETMKSIPQDEQADYQKLFSQGGKFHDSGRASGETGKDADMKSKMFNSTLGIAMKNVFKYKVLGMALGINGFVEKRIDAFYLPQGHLEALPMNEDAVATYEQLLGHKVAKFKSITKKNKGNNFTAWFNVVYKEFDAITAEVLDAKVTDTIAKFEITDNTVSTEGKLMFTFIAKTVQYMLNKEFVTAVLGNGTMSWIDVGSARSAFPATRQPALEAEMFDKRTPQLWDMFALQMSIAQYCHGEAWENTVYLETGLETTNATCPQ